jgi:hypothetical protein
MKKGNINYIEVPPKYNPVLDRLRIHIYPHYLEWRRDRYWVMEHRWDDMVNDIHIMITRLKEQNKGKLPPDLNLMDERFQQRVEVAKGKKDSSKLGDILEFALDLIWILG